MMTLHDQLQTLRLSQIKLNWESTLQEATQHSWSYTALLEHLCDLELCHREKNRLKRYMQEAKLPTGKTLANLEVNELEGVNPQNIAALNEQRVWIEEGHYILLFGASGRQFAYSGSDWKSIDYTRCVVVFTSN